MKIMQVLDKKVGDKTYYKYRINLPKDIVEDMNLINKNIKIKRENNRIIIEGYVDNEKVTNLTEKERELQREFTMLIKKRKKENNHN